jgi:NAD(P)-dependent dehydrogenase (short-subunit alcohol dehydrogenase family)
MPQNRKNYWHGKVALVTGGSAVLGRALAERLAQRGARIVVAARGREPLEAAGRALRDLGTEVLAVEVDVTQAADVERLFADARERFGQLDLVANCAGRSARGTVVDTPPSEFQALWELNFLGTLHCCQAAAPRLEETRGHLVNIGSLASKTAARYLGGYPASKFAVAALSQQLRLELAPLGIHVLLVCPGPIARDVKVPRYAEQAAGLPASASKPGGGAKVRAIDPAQLADKILAACEARRAELIVPAVAKWLFALSQLSPTLGDWILRRKT